MGKQERIMDYLTHLDQIHDIIETRKDFLGTVSATNDIQEEIMKLREAMSGETTDTAETTGGDSSTTDSSSSSSSADNSSTLTGKATAGGFVIPAESPLVPIVGGKVQIPSSRGRKVEARVDMGIKTNYAGYMKLPTDKFSFVESVGGSAAVQNNVAPDFYEICLLIYDALQQVGYVKPGGKIQINSAFRKNPVDGYRGLHMCGCAIDIGTARGSKDRYLIADTAWGLGLRSIAIGQGFVHIDCAGEYHWSYPGVPTYRGPGTY
jgi:hypothetical protein